MDYEERRNDAHHMHTKTEFRRDVDISWRTHGLAAAKASI